MANIGWPTIEGLWQSGGLYGIIKNLQRLGDLFGGGGGAGAEEQAQPKTGGTTAGAGGMQRAAAGGAQLAAPEPGAADLPTTRTGAIDYDAINREIQGVTEAPPEEERHPFVEPPPETLGRESRLPALEEELRRIAGVGRRGERLGMPTQPQVQLTGEGMTDYSQDLVPLPPLNQAGPLGKLMAAVKACGPGGCDPYYRPPPPPPEEIPIIPPNAPQVGTEQPLAASQDISSGQMQAPPARDRSRWGNIRSRLSDVADVYRAGYPGDYDRQALIETKAALRDALQATGAPPVPGEAPGEVDVVGQPLPAGPPVAYEDINQQLMGPPPAAAPPVPTGAVAPPPPAPEMEQEVRRMFEAAMPTDQAAPGEWYWSQFAGANQPPAAAEGGGWLPSEADIIERMSLVSTDPQFADTIGMFWPNSNNQVAAIREIALSTFGLTEADLQAISEPWVADEMDPNQLNALIAAYERWGSEGVDTALTMYGQEHLGAELDLLSGSTEENWPMYKEIAGYEEPAGAPGVDPLTVNLQPTDDPEWWFNPRATDPTQAYVYRPFPKGFEGEVSAEELPTEVTTAAGAEWDLGTVSRFMGPEDGIEWVYTDDRGSFPVDIWGSPNLHRAMHELTNDFSEFFAQQGFDLVRIHHVGTRGDEAHSPTGYHNRGLAVDISGVEFADGSFLDFATLTASPELETAVRGIISQNFDRVIGPGDNEAHAGHYDAVITGGAVPTEADQDTQMDAALQTYTSTPPGELPFSYLIGEFERIYGARPNEAQLEMLREAAGWYRGEGGEWRLTISSRRVGGAG